MAAHGWFWRKGTGSAHAAQSLSNRRRSDLAPPISFEVIVGGYSGMTPCATCDVADT